MEINNKSKNGYEKYEKYVNNVGELGSFVWHLLKQQQPISCLNQVSLIVSYFIQNS